MPIDQLFYELHTLELHDLCVLFLTTIQGHADFPGPRKHLWIFYSGFVIDMVPARCGEAFDNVQSVAMEIPRPVKPGLVIETRSIDYQRFSLPVTVRPSHPTIGGRLLVLIHIDGADRARILKDHHDVLRTLNNLKRLGHIHRAGHARQVALDLRIKGQPPFKVFLLFCRSRREIWNRATFDYSQPRRNSIRGTECDDAPKSGCMSFNLPISFSSALTITS